MKPATVNMPEQCRQEKAIALVSRLLDPEDLGFATTAEIRDEARKVLGRGPVESTWQQSTWQQRKPSIPQPHPERRDSPLPPPARLVREDGRPTMAQGHGQSRKHSLVESLANVAVGYGIALLSQILIFPHFGIQVSLETNVKIGICFTVVSVVRSYVIRRWFNGFKRRSA